MKGTRSVVKHLVHHYTSSTQASIAPTRAGTESQVRVRYLLEAVNRRGWGALPGGRLESEFLGMDTRRESGPRGGKV